VLLQRLPRPVEYGKSWEQRIRSRQCELLVSRLHAQCSSVKTQMKMVLRQIKCCGQTRIRATLALVLPSES